MVQSARCSLADLCAAVLHKRLDKNVPERMSSEWEESELSEGHINYAARDAYVSLKIFDTLNTIPTPQPLPPVITPGLYVALYAPDNTRVIAVGHLSPRLTQSRYDDINVTSMRTVITVANILVPGALLRLYKDQKALNDFGAPPFDIVATRASLRLIPPNYVLPSLPSTSSEILAGDTTSSTEDIIELEAHSLEPDTGDNLEFENLSEFDILDSFPKPLSVMGKLDLTRYEVDPHGANAARKIRESRPNLKWALHGNWSKLLRSRILKDPFHFMKAFRAPRNHGLRVAFARALRDAMFIADQEDVDRINRWGATQTPPLSYESLKLSSPAFILRHCRRIIPPPETLYPLVEEVLCTYGPLRDAQTGRPLFDDVTWKVARNALTLVQNGYISDPPDFSLYAQIGVDKKNGGLPLYRCFRGTNATEGGVHTHLRPRLPTSGASVRHVQACLLDFILRHNLLVMCFGILTLSNSNLTRSMSFLTARLALITALVNATLVITVFG